jgi:hypothetical protein
MPQTDALPTELRSPQIRYVRFPACYSTGAGTAKLKRTQALDRWQASEAVVAT